MLQTTRWEGATQQVRQADDIQRRAAIFGVVQVRGQGGREAWCVIDDTQGVRHPAGAKRRTLPDTWCGVWHCAGSGTAHLQTARDAEEVNAFRLQVVHGWNRLQRLEVVSVE